MFRTTTFSACVLFAAPVMAVAQQPSWEWVEPTYLENRPVTTMAAPDDITDPDAIELSSANGTARRVGEVRQASAAVPISQQTQVQQQNGQQTNSQQDANQQNATAQSETRQAYSNPPANFDSAASQQPAAQSQPPAGAACPQSSQTIVRYASAPQTIVYDNPQPITTEVVQRVEYPATTMHTVQHPVHTAQYIDATNASPWYSLGDSQVVQRASYSVPMSAAPVTTTYSVPVTTVARPATTVSQPVTVHRPTTVAYSNPAVAVPAVAVPAAVPAATVYPVDTTTYRPVLPILNLNNNSYVGRGLLGQPEVYTEGQPIRNVLRYLLP